MDFFEACKVFFRSDSGPPRWFSPLECGCRAPDSPLLLFSRGSLTFSACLHIPVKEDRTSFTGLESTIRSEYSRSPNRPIYLVGESHGGCLALAVTYRNPGINGVTKLLGLH
ncbi:hypothetical protein SLEP1_g48282 [Rubroshorea leprosula]|uniref:Uncharacterized protein n=1 Tax=Rubroshorea leprosula TaxID=152421 RepID=A0AAV5LW04_9ROSI|nr:hypothetical protein SLEP1_g48282 [Rubroshorea leprosula]